MRGAGVYAPNLTDALVLEGSKGMLGVGRSGGVRVITRTSVSLSTYYVPDSSHFKGKETEAQRGRVIGPSSL